MAQQIRGCGGHFGFPNSPKNTNVVEDVEFLLPVKYRQILLRDFRGEIENVSDNKRPKLPS